MPGLPANEYVEIRDGSHYYIAGTRIGLDVLIHAYRRGKTPEAILVVDSRWSASRMLQLRWNGVV